MWLVACSAPAVIWTNAVSTLAIPLRTNYCNLNKNTKINIHGNAFKNIPCEIRGDIWLYSSQSMLNPSSWRDDMEKLSPLLVLCEGNPPVTGGFPSQSAGNTELWSGNAGFNGASKFSIIDSNPGWTTVYYMKHAYGVVSLCFSVSISSVPIGSMWYIYPYPSWLFQWHWGTRTLAWVPMKRPWRILEKLAPLTDMD